jgi:hypothetical protein
MGHPGSFWGANEKKRQRGLKPDVFLVTYGPTLVEVVP